MRKIIYSVILILFINPLTAQNGHQPGTDWYQKKSKDTLGIDLFRTYNELLAGKKSTQIVVAVIDGGTDIEHPDLKANIWHNPGEIPFNNIDDDQNGYVDDTVGWNFIGNPNGEMVQYDNTEKARIIKKYSDEFDGMDAEDFATDPVKKARYEKFIRMKEELDTEKEQAEQLTALYQGFVNTMDDIREKTGSTNPSISQVRDFPVSGGMDLFIRNYIVGELKSGRNFSSVYKEFSKGAEELDIQAKYNYNMYYDIRKIVGDNYNNSSEKNYGNNNVSGPAADHGTHVAGIIAAVRNNGLGMNGIAENIRIMVLRAVPKGDERDKDVANAIRYAADNGARIINMSFGKEFPWNKAVVDSAVVYAVSKGVLLIHAAGNDHKNIDIVPNYPNDSLPGGNFASTWLEIGASTPSLKKLPADFSNFGKKSVDLFAPGYQIYSTIPAGEYDFFDGTSMAAPVTTGVAALIWSYYPEFTALEIRQILMQSVIKVNKRVKKPGGGKVKFKELSVSGGVVNAYQAVKLAAARSKNR